MGYTLSPDQQSIVDSRNQNILVSAAAGSGKTSVLTERIVKLVVDSKIDIDRVLVVTFTNAAAKEMKERIADKLQEALINNPEDDHLQKQSQLIYNAQITTIDSYCLYLLKNHFHRINFDPVFRVAGEGEMKLLKEDVMKEVIKTAYAGKNPDFYHLVDCYSKKDNDQTLEESILKLYTYAMSYPDPKGWLEMCRHLYDYDSADEFMESDYMRMVMEDAENALDKAKTYLEEAKDVTASELCPKGYAVTVSEDEAIILALKEKVLSGAFDDVVDFFASFSWTSLKPAPKGTDEEVKNAFQAARNSYKAIINEMAEDYFNMHLNNHYLDTLLVKNNINQLIDLVISFIDTFSNAKRDRAVIDFNDMEHKAIEILIKKIYEDGTYEVTDVAKDLRNFYMEVMVDEYQDSNLVQEYIIQSVSRETFPSCNNRFMVGDIKQSIYRFRLARPDIFNDKMSRYSKDATSIDRLITLKQNYRSRDSVIDSVNAIFKDIMTKSKGGIEYDEDAMLYRGGDFTEDTELNKTDVVLLDTNGLKTSDFAPYETDAIASKILNLVGNMEVTDKETKELRKATFKDIAVLFRSPSGWNRYIKDSFEKAGIPYHVEGLGKFYDTREIRDVLSFLQIVDNPLDDIALYASMTSCFGNLSDEDCVKIKAEDNKKNYYLWDKLNGYANNHKDDEKVTNFLALVSRYRQYVKYMPISELIITLFEETGYKNIVAALPDGKQRLANVNMLVLKANEYASSSFHGLFHFMRYIELIKKIETDEEEANIFDENSNAVRVLSIHKSKGLEFPICIVAGIEKTFNTSDYKEPFISDIDYGIGANCIDPEKRTKRPTIIRKAIINKMKTESLGEEIRILYVALTRAKEKLILFGGAKNAAGYREGTIKSSDNSYLGLIIKSLIKYEGKLFNIETPELSLVEEEAVKDEIDRGLLRKELELSANSPDDNLLKELKERLIFVYPYENLSKLYTKTSVSELKLANIEKDEEAHHVFEENESHEFIPSFAGGETLVKGTARGTAYHNLLQLTDFAALLKCSDKKSLYKELDSQIERILALKKMPKEDIEVIFKEKIVSFYDTDLAKRMGAAACNNQLFKEQPFVIGVKASDVDEEFPDDETVLIQGVIDAFFIENDEVVLLDYKTDRVDSKEELVNRYKKQLDYYEEAISKITGLKVKEKIIYSFRLNEVIFL